MEMLRERQPDAYFKDLLTIEAKYYIQFEILKWEWVGGICYVRWLTLRGSHGSAWAMNQTVNLD